MSSWCKISAPGSIMLMGEHAVLQGCSALACAVNRRLTIDVDPLDEAVLEIDSALGTYRSDLKTLEYVEEFRFILAAFRRRRRQMRGGVRLRIRSEFSDQVGLGSSAAVTVCAIAARDRWEGWTLDRLALMREAVKVIREVQGAGSGTDAAASVYGGLIRYSPDPPRAEKLAFRCPLSLLYAGYKTPTPEVIRRVHEHWRSDPLGLHIICDRMADLAEEAEAACRAGDVESLAEAVRGYQQTMRELGVSDDRLEELIGILESSPGITAAKISGSGLGDCVVGFGAAGAGPAKDRIDVEIEDDGVRID